VDEIVARYVAAARGGREALAAVKTLRMTGRAIAGPGREAIVRREIARPSTRRPLFKKTRRGKGRTFRHASPSPSK
jgi:hypothetical protein